MKRYAKFMFMITILFLLWIEISVGNIIYRTNSKGTKSWSVSNALSFMIHPFHKKDLWNISTIDINYPVIIMIASLIYHKKS